MDVRDAVEADADALAAIAGTPTDVMRNVIHDRTVRVAAAAETVPDDGSASTEGGEPRAVEGDESASAEIDDGTVQSDPSAGDGADAVAGFVSFDARDDVVHITQFGGETAAYDALLGEPARFARKEGMRVEVLVDAGDDDRRSALESAGFEYDGSGPTFEGQETVRYGMAP
ncbi:hypothetical protein ACFO0N_17840 [Halobium salinum]|uniref:N-acetyltransferase domain-containing protein n=1 Tax=Halobium salinum TaxID=1364940 RepID=A0ABD5PFW5_9EURY|nr:hypothetical protein [Halobium salinum]